MAGAFIQPTSQPPPPPDPTSWERLGIVESVVGQ